MNIDDEQTGTIAHIEIIHAAMGKALQLRDFVALLELTGDMELLVSKAAQHARVSAELRV